MRLGSGTRFVHRLIANSSSGCGPSTARRRCHWFTERLRSCSHGFWTARSRRRSIRGFSRYGPKGGLVGSTRLRTPPGTRTRSSRPPCRGTHEPTRDPSPARPSSGSTVNRLQAARRGERRRKLGRRRSGYQPSRSRLTHPLGNEPLSTALANWSDEPGTLPQARPAFPVWFARAIRRVVGRTVSACGRLGGTTLGGLETQNRKGVQLPEVDGFARSLVREVGANPPPKGTNRASGVGGRPRSTPPTLDAGRC